MTRTQLYFHKPAPIIQILSDINAEIIRREREQGIIEDLAEIHDIAAMQENDNNREPAPHTLNRTFEEANFKDEQIDHGYQGKNK
jgi:hypothetical protein